MQYADDIQLYIALNDIISVSTLSDCFSAVQQCNIGSTSVTVVCQWTQTRLIPLSSVPVHDNERKVCQTHLTFQSASNWWLASKVWEWESTTLCPSENILTKIHWLLIKHRIQYKIVVTVFRVLTTQQPNYFANIVRFHVASRQLRSCRKNLLHDDHTNRTFTHRAFSRAAPTVWNSIPLNIVSYLSCLASFKWLVKTELYNRAYFRDSWSPCTCYSSLREWLNMCYQPRNNNDNNNQNKKKQKWHNST